ncbi:MAG TPA: transposase [Kofleriaceae bacterium]|nr:transposase [Kofleriaceae bacterium]
MQRHALTDEQWARLQPLLPGRPQGRKAAHGDRLFVDAVIFRAKTGIQWRDLPERFGPWKSVYNRFRNWAQKDCWCCVARPETGLVADRLAAGRRG